MTAAWSSPDALGVVRDLPPGVTGAAFDPPVAGARAVPNLQDDPQERRISRVMVLALARVAEGRVIGVEPNTTVGKLLVDVLGRTGRPPANAQSLPPTN